MTGISFAATLDDPDGDTGKSTQYFEMFGHRGIWHDGWKAVAYHRPGSSFDDDSWELYDLTTDFNECHDLADDRARPAGRARSSSGGTRRAPTRSCHSTTGSVNASPRTPNASTAPGGATSFSAGMGHLPSDVAPDLRSRSYTITARVHPVDRRPQGVLDRPRRRHVRLLAVRPRRSPRARPQHRRHAPARHVRPARSPSVPPSSDSG